VLLLAAAWTAVWFYAARRAEDAVAAWIEREAGAGRLHACGSRTVGGYPFRIEMRCDAPRAELHGLGRPLSLRATSLLAVAQVYEPDLVIAELTGPLTVASADGTINYTLDWKLLQASLRGFPLTFQRASLAVDDLKLRTAGAPDAAPLGEARHIEMHVRLRSGEAEPVFDLAARADAARLPIVHPLAGQPIDAEAEAVLKGVKDLSPKPFDRRLREWQANGGRLEVAKIRVAQGDVLAVAKGDLGLTAQAHLEGSLRVMLAGIEQVGAMLLGQSHEARAQASLLGGLAMLAGGGELEGKRAVALPLRFKEGAVFLGPLPIGQIPPLY
jgi:hypothetical protein